MADAHFLLCSFVGSRADNCKACSGDSISKFPASTSGNGSLEQARDAVGNTTAVAVDTVLT